MAADAKFDYSRSNMATQPPAGASLSVIVSPAATFCSSTTRCSAFSPLSSASCQSLTFQRPPSRKSSFTGISRGCAVGHRAEIPGVARLADHHEVFADRAVEHAGIVPDGRHDFEEVGTGLVAEVVRVFADAA